MEGNDRAEYERCVEKGRRLYQEVSEISDLHFDRLSCNEIDDYATEKYPEGIQEGPVRPPGITEIRPDLLALGIDPGGFFFVQLETKTSGDAFYINHFNTLPGQGTISMYLLD